MQKPTDGVYRRETTGSGPVVLKAVPATGAAFSGFTMDHFFMRLSFPTPPTSCMWWIYTCNVVNNKRSARNVVGIGVYVRVGYIV